MLAYDAKSCAPDNRRLCSCKVANLSIHRTAVLPFHISNLPYIVEMGQAYPPSRCCAVYTELLYAGCRVLQHANLKQHVQSSCILLVAKSSNHNNIPSIPGLTRTLQKASQDSHSLSSTQQPTSHFPPLTIHPKCPSSHFNLFPNSFPTRIPNHDQ